MAAMNPPRPEARMGAPRPEISGVLLAYASRCLFRASNGIRRAGQPELGCFVDPELGRDVWLVLARGETASSCAWQIASSQHAAVERIPFSFTRETFHVLHEGELAGAGVLRWEGRRYHVHAEWDGFRPVARAVEVLP